MQFVIDLAQKLLEYPDMRCAAFGYAEAVWPVASLSSSDSTANFIQTLIDYGYYGGSDTKISEGIRAAREHFSSE